MKPSRYDDECPLAWYKWVWMVVVVGAPLVVGLWLSWKAVFG